MFEENYQGEHASLEDYARTWLEDTDGLKDIPKHLKNYIDFAAYGRDCELEGSIFTITKGYRTLHVFYAN